MKSTGIVRKVDPLGRIVIPKEIRDMLELNGQAPMEIFVSENSIILQKYSPGCFFCGEVNNTKRIEDNLFCRSCLDELVSFKAPSATQFYSALE